MKTDTQHRARLALAYTAKYSHGTTDPDSQDLLAGVAAEDAAIQFRILRAAVRAILPGKQSRKNIEGAMEAAVKATCRVIRRTK